MVWHGQGRFSSNIGAEAHEGERRRLRGAYLSRMPTRDIEALHANIATAFVSRAAQEFRKYEQENYTSKEQCEGEAANYAKRLKDHILDPNGWSEKLKRDYMEAQQNYEDTHHGWCTFTPGLCAAY